MRSNERTLVVLGVPGAGISTIIGSILLRYGGIDLMTIQKLEESTPRYDEIPKTLKSLSIAPEFDTPKGHHVVMLDVPNADCTVFIVAPDKMPDADRYQALFDALSHSRQVIVLVNKMDEFGWSEGKFREVVNHFTTHLDEKTVDITKVAIIPVSALHGDNLVELSPKGDWYNSLVRKDRGDFKRSATLLDILDISFEFND